MSCSITRSSQRHKTQFMLYSTWYSAFCKAKLLIDLRPSVRHALQHNFCLFCNQAGAAADCRQQLVRCIGTVGSVVAVQWHSRLNQIFMGTGMPHNKPVGIIQIVDKDSRCKHVFCWRAVPVKPELLQVNPECLSLSPTSGLHAQYCAAALLLST